MKIRCGDDLTAAQEAQEARAREVVAAQQELSVRTPGDVPVPARSADLLSAIAKLRTRIASDQSVARRLGSELSLRHFRTAPVHLFYTTRKRASDTVAALWKKVTGA